MTTSINNRVTRLEEKIDNIKEIIDIQNKNVLDKFDNYHYQIKEMLEGQQKRINYIDSCKADKERVFEIKEDIKKTNKKLNKLMFAIISVLITLFVALLAKL